MMLKNHLRIEAFLFSVFLALLTEALIEREARQRMRKLNIKKLPRIPEERPCTAPTTERLFELFEDLRRHRLVDKNGAVQQRFYDEPSEPQRAALACSNSPPRNTSPLPRRSAAGNSSESGPRKMPRNHVRDCAESRE